MSLKTYFRESVSELRRVTWPTRQQAFKISAVVLVVTFVSAIALGFFDAFLSWVASKIYSIVN